MSFLTNLLNSLTFIIVNFFDFLGDSAYCCNIRSGLLRDISVGDSLLDEVGDFALGVVALDVVGVGLVEVFALGAVAYDDEVEQAAVLLQVCLDDVVLAVEHLA